MDSVRTEGEQPYDINDSFTSKWQYIPLDLLYIIIDLYLMYEPDGDPRLFMQVCHHWRTALQHKASLWSKVALAHPTVYPDRRRVWGSEICRTPAELQAALERTTCGTIDLQCWFESSRWGAIDEPGALGGMIDIIKTSRSFLRIRRLYARSGRVNLMEKINFDEWEFPVLEEARLHVSSAALNKRIQETAHRLRFLSLIELDDSRFDWNLSKMTLPLKVELFGETKGAHLRPHLCQMILSAPNIAHLTLHSVPLPKDQRLFLPTLQSLEIILTHFEFNLDCPSLHTLDLHASFIPTSGTNPLILPSLKILKLQALETTELVHLHATSLETLEIHRLDGEYVDFIQIFVEQVIKPGHIHPKILWLQDVAINSSLPSILNQIPDLVEICIADCHVGVQFFEALAGCSLPAEPDIYRWQPICPSLQIFKYQIYADSLHNPIPVDMSAWLAMAVEARSKGGYPIKAAIRNKSWEPWTYI
ncbi:hypothetical protein FRC17_002711 [Serendipita sp. 399]|nr:hypothetical protein FRC17_002711 [Serendipita sp. 399]